MPNGVCPHRRPNCWAMPNVFNFVCTFTITMLFDFVRTAGKMLLGFTSLITFGHARVPTDDVKYSQRGSHRLLQHHAAPWTQQVYEVELVFLASLNCIIICTRAPKVPPSATRDAETILEEETGRRSPPSSEQTCQRSPVDANALKAPNIDHCFDTQLDASPNITTRSPYRGNSDPKCSQIRSSFPLRAELWRQKIQDSQTVTERLHFVLKAHFEVCEWLRKTVHLF